MARGTQGQLKRLALGLFLVSRFLYGHAILLSSSPRANQALAGPNITVQLHFNSRIDAKRSRVTLVGADGTRAPLSIEEQTSPDVVAAQVNGAKQGSYVVHWQVLAVDGHITQGNLPFRVH